MAEMVREAMRDVLREKRDLVLPPGTYAYMQDVTKGVIKTYTGPTVINPTAQEVPVVYNPKNGTFNSGRQLSKTLSATRWWRSRATTFSSGIRRRATSTRTTARPRRVRTLMSVARSSSLALRCFPCGRVRLPRLLAATTCGPISTCSPGFTTRTKLAVTGARRSSSRPATLRRIRSPRLPRDSPRARRQSPRLSQSSRLVVPRSHCRQTSRWASSSRSVARTCRSTSRRRASWWCRRRHDEQGQPDLRSRGADARAARVRDPRRREREEAVRAGTCRGVPAPDRALRRGQGQERQSSRSSERSSSTRFRAST
jgi:hypothetical protein